MIKKCKKCGKSHGVRKRQCECGEPFVIKSKKIKKFVPSDVEWNTLEKGDEIRIVAGYGPWHESLGIDGNTKRVYIGCDAGAYTIESIEKEGLFVSDGYHRNFVYMGETRPGVVGTKEPHKIKLIRKAEKVTE